MTLPPLGSISSERVDLSFAQCLVGGSPERDFILSTKPEDGTEGVEGGTYCEGMLRERVCILCKRSEEGTGGGESKMRLGFGVVLVERLEDGEGGSDGALAETSLGRGTLVLPLSLELSAERCEVIEREVVPTESPGLERPTD